MGPVWDIVVDSLPLGSPQLGNSVAPSNPVAVNRVSNYDAFCMADSQK